MKSILSCFAVALFLGAAIPSAQAQQPVPLDFFYDNLAPYGSWQEVGDYGYCWQPYDVDPGWQPYSNGRWVYTDVGWTWDSYEPFGWAVYHYGRWANLNGIGWIWVPGNEWGPGWVSWRHSPRYVGWAPLPPEALFLRAIGFSGWVDDYYNIGPNNYRFVENQNFGSPRLNSVFIDQRQNMQIIHQTTNITNITYVNNVVYNGGLGYDQQARQSAEPIHRYKLDRRQSFDGDRGGGVDECLLGGQVHADVQHARDGVQRLLHAQHAACAACVDREFVLRSCHSCAAYACSSIVVRFARSLGPCCNTGRDE